LTTQPEPRLFNRAIDWIIEHTVGFKGIIIRDLGFKDLDYTVDLALLVTLPPKWPDVTSLVNIVQLKYC